MIQETNIFKIVAVHSGKVLDAYAFGATQDTPILQHEYLGGANQHWRVSKILWREGYEISAVHSGLALMGAEDAINGSPVYQQTRIDSVWDNWLIEPVAGHPDRFIIRYKFNGKVLDVWLKGLQNGARVVLHDYLGGDNQHWQFVLVSR